MIVKEINSFLPNLIEMTRLKLIFFILFFKISVAYASASTLNAKDVDEKCKAMQIEDIARYAYQADKIMDDFITMVDLMTGISILIFWYVHT